MRNNGAVRLLPYNALVNPQHFAHMRTSTAICALSLLLPLSAQAAQKMPKLIDSKAGEQTVALYENLHVVGQNHVLFGHHDTLAYGHDWIAEPNRSDIKDVTGDFPAVYGWDLAPLEPEDMNPKLNKQRMSKELMLDFARQGYERGGVITYCWHASNPVTKKNFHDRTPAMHTMLPGGENHEYLKLMLDRFAEFFKELDPIPVVFRPYHEHNGEWFWWGKTNCSEEDFIAIWRFTVEYLRDVKEVHNLIYAFSPDRGRIDLDKGYADYFYAYPGDEYVDIIGLDDYVDVREPRAEVDPGEKPEKPIEGKILDLVTSLEMIVRIAEERGKVPALTETGNDQQKIPNWWTKVLLRALDANDKTRKVAWVEVWRNANAELEGHEHYFAPFKGHPMEADFIDFCNTDLVMLESDLPDMYKRPCCPKESPKCEDSLTECPDKPCGK